MKLDAQGGEGPEAKRRRRFDEEFRHRVVEETLVGDTSVSAVALRHRLNTNLVFTWRRKYLRTLSATPMTPVKMLPVTIANASASMPAVAPEPVAAKKLPGGSVPRGAIEIEWNGARIVLKGAVDAQALRVVLMALASR